MDKIYKAISDATRRGILKLLRERDMTAGEIAEHFDLTKPTLSRHFSVLREAGLVTDEKKGRNIIYRLNAELLENSLVSLMEDYSFGRRTGGTSICGVAGPRRFPERCAGLR